MKKSIIVLCILVLVACDANRIFEEHQELPGRSWPEDHKVGFDFRIHDTSVDYDLSINIRNAHSYPFYNLYYKYFLKDSTGRILNSELKEVHLFEPKSGEPQGDGLGDLFDHQFVVLEDYSFPQRGTYRLEFQQFMRRDTLAQILSVGARVERSN